MGRPRELAAGQRHPLLFGIGSWGHSCMTAKQAVEMTLAHADSMGQRRY